MNEKLIRVSRLAAVVLVVVGAVHPAFGGPFDPKGNGQSHKCSLHTGTCDTPGYTFSVTVTGDQCSVQPYDIVVDDTGTSSDHNIKLKLISPAGNAVFDGANGVLINPDPVSNKKVVSYPTASNSDTAMLVYDPASATPSWHQGFTVNVTIAGKACTTADPVIGNN